MRLTLACACALIAVGGTRASAQGTPTPPARLPSASPPVPAPVRDTVRPRAELLAPPVTPPPPAAAPRTISPVSVPASALIAAPPANATMRCKDGTYLTGAPATDRCRERGGVAAILPAPLPAPPAPAPRAP